MSEDVDRPSGPIYSWAFRVTYAPGSRRGVVRTTPDLTMHFLDICALDVTKRSEEELAKDVSKTAMAVRLRELDLPTNRFSCLLALMEKTSDTRSTRSDEDLQAQIVSDVGHMRRFFGEAGDGESNDYVEGYVHQLRRLPAELARAVYLQFLETANGVVGLHRPIARCKRFEVASKLIESADALGIDRQHPIMAVTLACLYGNRSARDVLKFTPDQSAYPAENVLADIMAIGRFLGRKLELEEDYWLGRTSIRHAVFITRDKGLEKVMSCFHGEALTIRDAGDHQEVFTRVRIDFADLLSEISHAPGPRAGPSDPGPAGPSEYERLCALIFPPHPREALPPSTTVQS